MKYEDIDRQKHLEEEKQIYTGCRGKEMLEMGAGIHSLPPILATTMYAAILPPRARFVSPGFMQGACFIE